MVEWWREQLVQFGIQLSECPGTGHQACHRAVAEHGVNT